jgi:hypothetical protein
MMWVVFPCLEIEDILPISGLSNSSRYYQDIKIQCIDAVVTGFPMD